MQDIKRPFCVHPKFGAKMQRVYKRADSLFVPIGLLLRFVQKGLIDILNQNRSYAICRKNANMNDG
jgi:hypothetical protein